MFQKRSSPSKSGENGFAPPLSFYQHIKDSPAKRSLNG